MNETVDPVVHILTGRLPFHLITAAVLTWPIAMGLLALYTRAVRKSMRARALGTPAPAPVAGSVAKTPKPPSKDAGPLPRLSDDQPRSAGVHADQLLKDLRRQPWRIAAVYVAGGLAYALVANVSMFLATGLEWLPIRFTTLLLIYAWPIVIAVGIVATPVRRVKVLIAALYFLLLIALVAMVMPYSPDMTWGQLPLLWGIYNLPDTILFLLCLARPVRAVGPLILTVMFIALAGSDVGLQIAAGSENRLRFVVDVAIAVGLGGTASFFGVIIIGFAVFGVLGWIALNWIKRRYQAKLISDESLTVDSVFLLFAVTHSMGLVFEHAVWALAAVAAFAAYKATVRFGFSRMRLEKSARPKPPRLLLLRSFSIGKNSERLFDALEKHWRRVGSIQLIAGIDLARRNVEPHEFLDFMTGKLARRFITGPDALARRLGEIDTQPDRDLRFRVNDFFCYDDTWKMTLSALARESDAVLMDLRGFSRQNSGCIFEIHELAATVPLERVVFVTNERTDEDLLAQTLRDAEARLPDGARSDRPRPVVLKLPSMRWRELKRLLLALAVAAEPVPTRVTANRLAVTSRV